MRRSLIVTVAATVTMVLLAMLIPMAVLVQSYALEDRLSRAALEVQATETVVSGQDKGAVSVYVDRVNRASASTVTTVLYPDGTGIGPNPGEDARVREARRTGQARVDDTDSGAQILVPVSLGGSSTLPSLTPVVRVDVLKPGLGSGVFRAWVILALLGAALLAGSLVLADRLGRSFVQPILALAADAQRLGDRTRSAGVTVSGPAEVKELGVALNRLVGRIEVLLEREREGVANLSHRLRTPVTALRLRIDGLDDAADRERISADLDELEGMVDHLVREARRSEREGLVADSDAAAVLSERARFWAPLAEDQGRPFELDLQVPAGQRVPVQASEPDLVAVLDVLLDNVFSYTDEGVPVAVTLIAGQDAGLTLIVDDGGPGYPDGLDVTLRGISGAGSTGLGMSIVDKTATESGGRLVLGRSPLGGARATVVLGPPA
ncbi:putative Two-component system histidine kinase [metagenome]|uniref:histidine kinase n=1 Tax=metagenome TaxID=256318 RepID=A0A2P2C715_9ZZZZ